jgi:hypothetical protein
MLLSTGQFMGHARHKAAALNGLLIDFNYTDNWIGPAKIAIYGGETDIVESMAASSPAQQIITGFDDLAAGEYNTDSDYNSNVTWWNQPWPGNSSPHWSDNKTSSLKAWFKFPLSLSSLTKVRIRFRNPTNYGLPPNILFSDMQGKSYVPVSAPADVDDYIDIISNDRMYEWSFS